MPSTWTTPSTFSRRPPLRSWYSGAKCGRTIGNGKVELVGLVAERPEPPQELPPLDTPAVARAGQHQALHEPLWQPCPPAEVCKVSNGALAPRVR